MNAKFRLLLMSVIMSVIICIPLLWMDALIYLVDSLVGALLFFCAILIPYLICQDQQQPQPLIFEIKTTQTNAFRLLIALDKGARPVLQRIFSIGAKSKDPNHTLEHYLKNERNMTHAQYKKCFNRTMREKIDKDPSCKSFDISLWLPCIQWACSNLAHPVNGADTWNKDTTSLEYHMKKIKDSRNDANHSELELESKDFESKLEDIKDLLIKTLKLASSKYGEDTSDAIRDTEVLIDGIKNSPLAHYDLVTYENQTLLDRLQDILKTAGLKDLTDFFHQLSHVNPASMIIGYNINLKVESVFTSLAIVEVGRRAKNQPIDHNDILSCRKHLKAPKDSTSLQVLLIEGIAGSGKTTLVKRILSDWISGVKTGNTAMKHLNAYQFILHLECRNKSFSTLSSLIASLMPTTRQSFQDDDQMKNTLLLLPTLILADGLDEVNSVSKDLFMDIIKLNLGHVTVICTSRPEKINDFYTMVPPNAQTVHIKIRGVPKTSMKDFLMKYHNELIIEGISTQKTDGLISYFSTTCSRIDEHWSLPFNLTLLAVLWAIDPQRVNNITTPVELLHEIYQLSTEKLLERLNVHEMTKNFHRDDLEKKINQVRNVMCLEALRGLRDDNLSLSRETKERIEEDCTNHTLPHQEIIGSFMVQTNSWSPTGMETSVSYAHKGLQEYQSGLYVFNRLIDSASNVPQDRSIRGILKEIHDETITDSGISMVKYQNLLTILMGIMYTMQKDLDEQLIKELIELLIESGINDLDAWCTILNNVRCTDAVSKQIAQIPGLLDRKVDIEDSNVLAMSKLVKTKGPQSVDITIKEDQAIIAGLPDLLNSLSDHRTTIDDFYMEPLFRRHSEDAHLQHSLQRVTETCPFEGNDYMGQLTDTMKEEHFPKVEFLSVSIGSSPQAFNTLQRIITTQNIQFLDVCLDLSLRIESLTPLNGVKGNKVNVFIPDVAETDIEKLCKVLNRLVPTQGIDKSFYRVLFPRLRLMSEEQIISLILEMKNQMGSNKIREFLVFPSMNLLQAQMLHLDQMAKNTLGCSIIWRRDAEFSQGIWDMDTWDHPTNDESDSDSNSDSDSDSDSDSNTSIYDTADSDSP